jgi:hypothetical protein
MIPSARLVLADLVGCRVDYVCITSYSDRTALAKSCRQSARNLNASNANRKKNLVPGGVAGHETLGLLRIAFAGITSQHRGKGRQVGGVQ